jgi:predicted MFS family arabinose efflux permease
MRLMEDGDRLRYRDALAVREFRAIFASVAVSICGSVVSSVALTILVYQRTASPLLASLTFALGFFPYLAGGLLLSAVVDRVPPRRLLVGIDLSCTALVAAMAWPGMPVPALLALVTATGALTSTSAGARAGLVRSVVPEAAYVPARSLLRIAAQAAQVAGNGVGGILVVLLTARGAILVDAVSFAASAAIVRFGLSARPARGRSPERSHLVVESLRNARDALSRPLVRRLLLFGWLVPMFSVAPEALAAPYVSDAGGSAALVGWWLVALPVGIITGDILGIWALPARRQRRLVGPLAAASFVPYLAFVWSPPVAVALPLLVLSGLCSAYSLGLDALVRDAVPAEAFARTMTVNTSGLMFLQGLGFAIAGACAELVGSSAAAIALAGVAGLVVVALLGTVKEKSGRRRTRGSHGPAKPSPDAGPAP